MRGVGEVLADVDSRITKVPGVEAMVSFTGFQAATNTSSVLSVCDPSSPVFKVCVQGGSANITFAAGTVPEPASLGLLGAGLAGLGMLRRRKSK